MQFAYLEENGDPSLYSYRYHSERKKTIIMANYTIGEILREVREREKYSQEELSFGICTPSTLSRIETGAQIPGRRILEALTQRLGITDTVYTTYMGKEELELHENRKRLMRSISSRNYSQAKQLAVTVEQELQRLSDRGYRIHMEQQYLLFAKAVLLKKEEKDRQKVLDLFMKSLSITMPDFDGVHIKNRLLTFQEISILNNIGCMYHEMGKQIEAFQLMFALKEYMEQNVKDEEEKARKYPMILQNVTTWLGQAGCYKDALKLCQEGLDYCIEHGKLQTFPMLLYNKAAMLAELGQSDMSRQCFIQTIAVFQAVNQHQRAEDIRNRANRDYHMNV